MTVHTLDVGLRGTRDYIQGSQILSRTGELVQAASDAPVLLVSAKFTQITELGVRVALDAADTDAGNEIGKAQYEAKGVHFVMLNSSLEDSRDEIIHEAAHLGVPMLADSLQLVGRSQTRCDWRGARSRGSQNVRSRPGLTWAKHCGASFAVELRGRAARSNCEVELCCRVA